MSRASEDEGRPPHSNCVNYALHLQRDHAPPSTLELSLSTILLRQRTPRVPPQAAECSSTSPLLHLPQADASRARSACCRAPLKGVRCARTMCTGPCASPATPHRRQLFALPPPAPTYATIQGTRSASCASLGTCHVLHQAAPGEVVLQAKGCAVVACERLLLPSPYLQPRLRLDAAMLPAAACRRSANAPTTMTTTSATSATTKDPPAPTGPSDARGVRGPWDKVLRPHAKLAALQGRPALDQAPRDAGIQKLTASDGAFLATLARVRNAAHPGASC